MRNDRKSREGVGGEMIRAGMMPCGCAFLALFLAGCSHKQVRVHIPVASPVDLETVTMPDDQINPVPEPEIAPLQWPEPPRPPVRRRPPPREDAGTTPPVEPNPPELTIGALTTGGESTPQSQQHARELIAWTERRITSLPERIASSQRSQLRQARNYLDESKKALNTGDTDGAMNLANKAKLLMDELERL